MRAKIKYMCYVALAAAILCVLAPWSIPIGGLPLTLSLFAVLLISYILPLRVSLGAVLVYIALGAVGMPVFAGFVSGFQAIVGPTGGFILAYPLVAIVASKLGGGLKKNCAFGVISTILCYFIGSLWLSFTTDAEFLPSLGAVAVSYGIFDMIKAVSASLLAEAIKPRLNKFTERRGHIHE